MSVLRVSHMGGITSCLSVGMHELARHRAESGQWPDALDMSGSFHQYRDHSWQDVAGLILAPSRPDHDAAPLEFDHGWQYGTYADMDLKALNAAARRYLWPSEHVGRIAYGIAEASVGRACVLYRGNDKSKEIARTPYSAMIEMAHDCGRSAFAVQTDELGFYEEFKRSFPDTVRLTGLPMIPRNDDGVVVGGSAFAAKYLAATWVMSQSRVLLTNTGNTALWCAIYRGHASGLWQYHPILRRFIRPTP